MNAFKRFFALILSLCMVLSYVPVSAFATGTEVMNPDLEGELTLNRGEIATTLNATTSTGITVGTKPENGSTSSISEPFNTTVSANYRIPGLVYFNGQLIATADARWDTEHDGGGLDLVVSRMNPGTSTNWSYTFAGYLGDNGNAHNVNSSTLMDPVVVTDGSKLYLFADMYPAGFSISSSSTDKTFSDTEIGFDGQGRLLLSNDDRNSYGYYLSKNTDGTYTIYTTNGNAVADYTVDGWFNLYQNGAYVTNLFFEDSPYEVRATSYICMMSSTDGVNWSNPTLLNVKPSGVSWMVLGPGSGVYTKDGDIAFTAYDNTNIYLIHGNETDGWKRIRTNAAGNESSIIELNNGTIRAFVKRGSSNTIAYVDFTPDGNGSYTAGSLVDTTIRNFSNCMVSSLHYSRTLSGKEVVLVCCPSKENQGQWAGRFNGKIHVFTLDAANNNAMTRVGAYVINGESNFFAYSNMAELPDGTIAYLYENDCISYSAGGYSGTASHITYNTVDLETALSITFDEVEGTDVFVWSANNNEGQVAVKESAGVTHVHAQPNTNVAGIADTYVAYDIVLCLDAEDNCPGFSCTNIHEGAATVSIPLGDQFDADDQLKGFVVNDDGTITYIVDVTRNATLNTLTFVAPHFSTVGVTAKTAEDLGVVEKDVTIKVSYTYEDTLEGINLTGSNASDTISAAIANASWASIVSNTEGTLIDAANDGTKVTLADCEFAVNVTGTSDNNVNGSASIQDQDNATWYIDPNSKGYWNELCELQFQFNDDGSVYIYKVSNSNYLYVDRTSLTWDRTSNVNNSGVEHSKFFFYAPVTDAAESSTELPGYKKVTSASDLVTGNYLIAFTDNSGNLYVMNAIARGTEAGKQMAKVQVNYNTKVTITGVSVGNTSVIVGTTKYNITVAEQYNQQNVTLQAGQSTTLTDDTGNYQNDVIKDDLDENIATVVVTGENGSVTYSRGDEVTTLAGLTTGKYLIVSLSANKYLTNASSGGRLQFGDAIDSTSIWTITPSDNGYYVQDTAGNYLYVGSETAGVGNVNEIVLDRDTNWRIKQYNTETYLNDHSNGHTVAGGWPGATDRTDDVLRWKIFKVVENVDNGSTTIDINGVSEGETSVVVGNTRYNITVTYNEVDVELFAGQSTTITDNTGNYEASYTGDGLNENVATLVVDGTTVKSLVRVDSLAQLSNDKRYIIATARGETNNKSNTVLSTSSSGNCLTLSGRPSVDTTYLWTIENDNGTYYIKNGDNYLHFGDNTSSLNSQSASVTLTAGVNKINGSENITGWTIVQGSYGMNFLGYGPGNTKAGGWSGSDVGSLWWIYEIVTEEETTIEITGVSGGETSVVVGNTRYNISVLNEVDVVVEEGKTTTIHDDTGDHTADVDRTELDVGVATVDATKHYTASSSTAATITPGTSYLIVTGSGSFTNCLLTSNANGSKLALQQDASKTPNNLNVWTLVAVDGGYKLKSEAGYLTISGSTVAVDDTGSVLTIELVPDTTGNRWRISTGGQYLNSHSATACGTYTLAGSANANSHWFLHEVTTTTDVTVTGVTAGETSAIVGNTRYNITVTTTPRDAYVDVIVGDSKTVIDNTGNYQNNVNRTDLDEDIATVTVTGSEGGYLLGDEVTGDLEDGTYIIVSDRSSENLTNVDYYSRLQLSGSTTNITDNAIWKITKRTVDGNTTYYIQDANNKYLAFTSTSGLVRGEEFEIGLTWSGDHWKITQAGTSLYLNDHNDTAGYGTCAGGWDTPDADQLQNDYALRWRIYKVSKQEQTNITINGIAVGKTSVVVGNTRYHINVMERPDPVTVDVTLYLNQTQKFEIDGIAYDASDLTIDPADIAGVTVEGKIRHHYELGQEVTAQGDLAVGKQYVFVNNSAGKTLSNTDVAGKLALEGTTDSINESVVWTIVAYDAATGVAQIQDSNGNYLTIGAATASVGAAENDVNVWRQGDYWTIREYDETIYLNNASGNGLVADGYNYSEAFRDENSKWSIYEVSEANISSYTDVTIVGENPGTTTATVGHVTYNITVEAEEKREITLYVNTAKTEIIESVTYTNKNVTQQPDGSIAFIHAVDPDIKRTLTPATSIVSGNKYVIYNVRANKSVTDGSIDGGLSLAGTATHVLDTAVWTINGTGTDGVYNILSADGKYMTIGSDTAAVVDDAQGITLSYNGTNWTLMQNNAYLNDAGQKGTTAAGWVDSTAATDGGSLWLIYEVQEVPGDTKVYFSGVSAGKTTAKVGHVIFEITVLELSGEDNLADFNSIVGIGNYSDGGSANLEMTGEPIKSLRISEGATFQLDVDIDAADYDTLVWRSGDTDIATVDENGLVTAVAAGETYVSATVTKDGVSEEIKVLVTVVPSMVEGLTADQKTHLFYYIESVHNTDPYYTLFLSSESTTGPVKEHEMVMVTEGEVIWLERPKNAAVGVVWTADPFDGTALTFMAATNSRGEYYPLKTDAGTLGSGTVDGAQYYKGNNAYNNVVSVGNDVSASWEAGLIAMLEESLLVGKGLWNDPGCDGAMSMTRWDHDSVSAIVTSLTFTAERLPEVSKTIYGVLGSSGDADDWNEYEDGMYARVGDYVYFQIDVTIEAPITWEKDNNGNVVSDEFGPLAALEYSTDSEDTLAQLVDNLPGAYFYTKDLDEQDGDRSGDGIANNDGYIVGSNLQSLTQNVKAALNRGWTDAEIEAGKRVLTYYVVYQIPADFLAKGELTKTVENSVDLQYTYTSTYSSGSKNSSGHSQAAMNVIGMPIDDVIIEFGLPIYITSLTTDHGADNFDPYNTNNADGGCEYGEITVLAPVDEDDPDTPHIKEDTWTVVYTPTEVFESYDIVYLMSANNTLLNAFRVRPASTVYYEESLLEFGTAVTGATTNGWSNTDGAIVGYHEYMHVGCKNADHNHSNFGRDAKYDEEEGMSNGTQAVSSKAADTATFTFSGTGFEIYGNSTQNTSVMAALLYRLTNVDGTVTQQLVKFYQVDTANRVGKTDATAGQNLDNAYGLPLVSVNDLPYGNYKVVIQHTQNPNKPDSQILIDGVRIFNTVEESDEYYPAEEQNVTFTELRDEVLYAANVDASKTQIYNKGENIISNTVSGATVVFLRSDDVELNNDPTTKEETNPDGETTTKEEISTLEDWLKNSPKNEIWMLKGDTLAFVLYAGDATTKAGAVANAQIGLKAPTKNATVTITLKNGETTVGTKDYTITSSTDMFYELPDTNGVSLGGLTVTITVSDGILSVTKLKTNVIVVEESDEGDEGNGNDNGNPVLASVQDEHVANVLSMLYGTENESGNGGEQETVVVKPNKIVNVVSGVHVYWNAVEGAVKYGLWRSETGENGTYKWLGNPTVPHFTDVKVESGKTYHYKVTVMDENGVHSDKSSAISITYVATPDITSRFNKAAGISLGWNKIEGATGYAIYRKTYSGSDEWTRIATIEGNSTFTWQDTSVKNNNGAAYKYTIRALAGSDMKTLSGCRNAGRSMVRLTSRVLNSAAKATDNSIKCSWTTSAVVTGYEVRFMVGTQVYKTFTVGNYKTGVKTFNTLKAGENYKIQVRSYVKIDGMGFYSAWSEAKYANTFKALSFKEIPSSYYFSSGAGGWGTDLSIEKDGSFSGSFHDSDMGVTGAGYPNGTVYHCSFSGKFSSPEAVNAHTYKMTMESYATEKAKGHEEIKNGIKYIATDAYGIDGPSVYYIYLPGTPADMLPEGVYDWVKSFYGETYLASSYIICSENGKYPFIATAN